MAEPVFSKAADREGPLYQSVADALMQMIEKGTLGSGDRMPSVRTLARDWNISITTVTEAYRQLENRGVIETRPQSGHYVRSRFSFALPEPELSAPEPSPSQISLPDLAQRVLRDAHNPDLLQLGAAIPNPDLLPTEKLNRALGAVSRRSAWRESSYELVPGVKQLRVEVARRAVAAGCALTPDEILITTGCTEALALCLQAVCEPGDAVAVESPTYYGVLQAIRTFGLRVVEIPTHPRNGMSLEALKYAAETHRIAAVLVHSNFSNPLGCQMSDERKREMVEYLASMEVPLIEDDIYGDLCYGGDRPKVFKAWDRYDNVLLCSSFSKSLAPGFRVGWVAPGRWQNEILQLKTVTTLATATLPQLAIAEFLANGGYEHHLRKLRRALAGQMAWLSAAVGRHFPQPTRITRPTGGYVLWVELPAGVDSRVLYERAVRAGITITPGTLFSAKGDYQNFIRLNAAFVNEKHDAQIALLGGLVRELVG